jgi:hypothetical protein
MTDVTSPTQAAPHVQWNHIDGPLLTCRDGTPHWLTLWERLGLRAGFITLDQLDKQHNSEPTKG